MRTSALRRHDRIRRASVLAHAVHAGLLVSAYSAFAGADVGPQTSGPNESAAYGRGTLFYPEGPRVAEWRLAVGALMDVLPRRVVESEQRQIPELTAQFRYGLPFGLSVDLRVAAIVIKNSADIGLIWAHAFGKLWLGAMDHLGILYGALAVAGFDATSLAYTQQPGLLLGVPLDNHRFTLASELLTTFGQSTRLGDSELASRRRFDVAGASWTITVETLLDGGGELYFGVGAIFAHPEYQAWMAFSDDRGRLLYPRFTAGYVF